MINTRDILETIHMIEDENLDIRTITMGISLLDCCSQDIDDSCRRVYDKIARKAEKLVRVGCEIEKEYGVPIINKRIAVTPIAMLAATPHSFKRASPPATRRLSKAYLKPSRAQSTSARASISARQRPA